MTNYSNTVETVHAIFGLRHSFVIRHSSFVIHSPSHCSKIRIQFLNRIASISSSLKPRSISRPVRPRLSECFASSGTKCAWVNLF